MVLGVCIKKSIMVALVVGTTLTLINMWSLIINLSFSVGDFPRLGLNYLVPFLVATYSRLRCMQEFQASETAIDID